MSHLCLTPDVAAAFNLLSHPLSSQKCHGSGKTILPSTAVDAEIILPHFAQGTLKAGEVFISRAAEAVAW